MRSLDPELIESKRGSVDCAALAKELVAQGRRDPQLQGFDLSIAVRMLFSCLVDADFRDTEAFYGQLEGRRPDRVWPRLQDHLPDVRVRFDAHMELLPNSWTVSG